MRTGPSAATGTVTPDRPELLAATADELPAVLLTGPRGSGKTHLLRAVCEAQQAAGHRAHVLSADALGRGVPLGVFAGVPDLPREATSSPAALIDAFARRRSQTVLLVDDADELDDASLYVVSHLLRTTRLRAVLAVRDLTTAPATIQSLYDSGDLRTLTLGPLPDEPAGELVELLVGGPLTPSARAAIVTVSGGNPLHLREVVRGSVDEGHLVSTPHGWDLVGSPVASPRLAQLVGERFDGLDATTLEAAALVALAGEVPASTVGDEARRALARADVIEPTVPGWIRLSHPLDAEHLRRWCPPALWHELVREAVDALRSPRAAERQQARRRADVLALDHGLELETDAALALAEQALGAYDEHLALRAAQAVTAVEPTSVDGHRLAGLAASALGRSAAADTHLTAAHGAARTDAELATVALARAQHLGLRHHDARAALDVVHEASGQVSDPEWLAHLERDAVRWGTVAGRVPTDAQPDPGAAGPTSVAGAMGLITAALAGVISGPLEQTTLALAELREIPAELVALVPGGSTLVELAEVMALSYTGDVVATRRRLQALIAGSDEAAPESLGTWEYTLGFLELLSCDAERAHTLGSSAVQHLAWRDSTGLLPAAHALVGAAAAATGRDVAARTAFESVPEAAATDPKVVMLRGWADAWQATARRRPDHAAQLLLDTAGWLMTVQHTFFGGMLAHCAARLDRRADEAAALLRTAAARGGGGLLDLLVRHADATVTQDVAGLEAVAADALELGVDVTAADAHLWFTHGAGRASVTETRSRRHRVSADGIGARAASMALWMRPTDRSTLLTAREERVARLAADRYTAKEIAVMNGVSANTVTNQLASAFRKLGVSSRAELREALGTTPGGGPADHPEATG